MDVSYRWLEELTGRELGGPESVADRLAARGAPVESITRLSEGLEAVVVGRVAAVERHPNADRLWLCRVDAGEAPVEVVCGAPEVVEGACYPFAPAGSTLPGGLRLERRKIRGIVSNGMLCSEVELGLGTDSGGIMMLPDGHEPGVPLVRALGLDDVRLDVEVTSNRPDMLSHLGIARELTASGESAPAPVALPGSAAVDLEFRPVAAGERIGGVAIRTDDPELCPRYIGAVVRGVSVGPSPTWLARRLRAAGGRPINNVVDATNYVLMELGQPLHAFDLARLGGSEIVVRTAAPGETLRTLDGVDRRLTPDMLMICDAEAPVAIAGVMGGLDSEVTAGTVDVLLECALFQPASIRSTRKALDMSTDASYRFERGVDPAGMELAVRRAVELIVLIAGGRADPSALDARATPWEPAVVELRTSRVEHLLGVRFTGAEIRRLLEPLGFGFGKAPPPERGTLTIEVPGYRSYDVTREVDLIEEVARTHGFDAFPDTLRPFRPTTVPDHPLFQLEEDLRRMLSGEGLLEAHTVAFAAAGEVRIPNPVSADDSHLRRELLGGLLGAVAHNLAREQRDVRLFEMGTVFRAGPGGERPVEHTHLAIALTGRRDPEHWSAASDPVDRWDLMGIAERVLGRVYPGGALSVGGEGTDVPAGLESRGAMRAQTREGDAVGVLGRVRPSAVDAPPWAGEVWGLELRLPSDPERAPPVTAVPLPAFPGIERDLALIVSDGVTSEQVVSAIRDHAGRLLARVAVFDVYRGSGVPEGARSLAVRLRFQSSERTLRSEDVDSAERRVLKRLEEELDVRQRV